MSLSTSQVGKISYELRGPMPIDASTLIFEIVSGSITGDGISGKVSGPSADWAALGADGIGTMDVRVSFQMDDGSFVLVTYNGRIRMDATGKPEYLVSTPLFTTSSEKYGYLKQHQYIAVMDDGIIMPTEEKNGELTYSLYRID